MSKARTHANNAERQRAYRARLQARLAGLVPPTTPPRSRPLSRVARLDALLDAAVAIRDEYNAWLERLPENLVNSPMGQRLVDTVDQLDVVVDILAALEPPKGFGRD